MRAITVFPRLINIFPLLTCNLGSVNYLGTVCLPCTEKTKWKMTLSEKGTKSLLMKHASKKIFQIWKFFSSILMTKLYITVTSIGTFYRFWILAVCFGIYFYFFLRKSNLHLYISLKYVIQGGEKAVTSCY